VSSDQNKAKLLNRLSAHRIPVLCTVVFLFLIVLLSILELTKAESVAITLTGVVIIWYTWETHQLKSEMKRQTALMLKPYVIATPDSVTCQKETSILTRFKRNVGCSEESETSNRYRRAVRLLPTLGIVIASQGTLTPVQCSHKTSRITPEYAIKSAPEGGI